MKLAFLRISLFFLLFACAALGVFGRASGAAADAGAAKLPVTTASPEAAKYFESGMLHYENHRWNLALADWQLAVKLDPNFAQAYVWICFTTADPAEEARDRAKAKALITRVSPGEQLLIRWMADFRESHYVEGIAAMNDMLAMFPDDKRLNFLVGYWLYRQDQYEYSKKLTLRALAQDPSYATCYNQLGYLYSRLDDINKALEMTAKYVELLPSEPNPHDSYGEMLRFAARYDEALEQYRLALKIDPSFYISQKELGETYSLMGNEEQARKEYEKAIQQAPSEGVRAEYLQKLALTYVREKNYAEADRAYLEAAAKAHAAKQWLWEARAHRVMAMYEPDQHAAMKNLDRALTLLAIAKGKVAQVDLNEENARAWRVRAERKLAAGDLAAAKEAVDQLEAMASVSSNSSINIQRIYHGAAGTLLFGQKQYADAIPHLEEDVANPLSMKLLITAYRETGAAQEATITTQRLREWKVPSIEEALVSDSSSAPEGVVAGQN
jgi:tetratricopeptide (TPR) repeat protein